MNTEKLVEQIQSGRIQDAVAFVSSARDYNNSEELVTEALGIDGCPREVVDAALECFVSTRQNRTGRGGHGSWVHSLSHFSGKLWWCGLKDWIRRLNEIAFAGANELGETSCSDRLLGDFSQYAKWDTVPSEYGYTEENLRWARGNGDLEYRLALIQASPFDSEIKAVRFDLGWSSSFVKMAEWTQEYGQPYVVDLQKIRDTVKKLDDLGDNTSDLAGIEQSFIRQFMVKIEEEIRVEEPGWNREKRLPRSLELSRQMLANMGA